MLTDREIKNAKPDPARPVRLADEAGLYISIRPDGAKWWRFDYTFEGRRNTISFGTYPTVTLGRAREKRLDAKRLLDQGVNPSAARRDAKAEASGAILFRAEAEAWLTLQGRRRAPRTMLKLRSILDNYLLPKLGPRPLKQITPPEILAVLTPIDAEGLYETAHRARQIAAQVFRFAISGGTATSNPAADLVDRLTPVKVEHHAALTRPAEIGRLLRSLDTCPGSTVVCAALRLAPRVFVRPSELREAEWAEFDLDGTYPTAGLAAPTPMWRIPAARMKMKTEHLVPLSQQAVVILRALHPVTGGGRFVFPSLRHPSRTISNMTLTAAIRRLGYTPEEQSVHGFRSIASTRLNELGWNSDLIELQLAHRERNQVRAAYNNAERLQERIEMMQAYADHLDALRAAADAEDAARRLPPPAPAAAPASAPPVIAAPRYSWGAILAAATA